MESKKQKPLEDITNTYNLIPTSTLRELVEASSNRNNLRSKPPISILKSVSSSTNQRLCSDSSNKSDASIGSSIVNSARNSRNVQFRTPQDAIASSNNLGGSRRKDATCSRREATGKGNKEGKTDVLIVNPAHAKKINDKGKGVAVSLSSLLPEDEARDVPIVSPTPMEKREDKGKGVAVLLSSSPTESEADDALNFDATPIEKRKDKGKGVSVPFSLSLTESEDDEVLIFDRTPIEKKNDKGKGAAIPSSSSTPDNEVGDVPIFGPTNLEKRGDKRKGIAVQFSSSPTEGEAGNALIFDPTSIERREDKGKGVAVSFSSLPTEDEADEALIFGQTLIERRKGKGKGTSIPSSLYHPENEAGGFPILGPILMEKMEDKRKAIAVPFSSSSTESEADDTLIFDPVPIEKRKDKGKGVAVPFSSSPTESEADGALIFGRTPVAKKRDKGKGAAIQFSSSPSESEDNDVLIFGHTPTEKRIDKRKAVDVSFSLSPNGSGADFQTSSSTPVEKGKEKENGKHWGVYDIHIFGSKEIGNAVSAPSSLSPHEKEGDVMVSSPTPSESRKGKEKAIDIPYGLSTQTMKDYQDGTFLYTPLKKNVQQEKASLNVYGRSYGKAEKGEAVLNSSSSSMGTQEMIEKGIATRLRHSNKKGNKAEGIDRTSGSSSIKRKEKVKEFVLPPIKRTKEKEKHLNLLSSVLKKTRDTRKAIPQHSNTVDIARHETSNTVRIGRQPRRRKNEVAKSDAGASSCPPLRRTRNLQDDLNEVGDVKSSNSWTDPHLKSRKKSRSRIEPTELPQDFIKQQKAYFKEVDEFELEEEEASPDELD